jgi:hypothetical protein
MFIGILIGNRSLDGFTTKENEFRWEFCWVSSEGAFGGICFGISLLTVCMFMWVLKSGYNSIRKMASSDGQFVGQWNKKRIILFRGMKCSRSSSKLLREGFLVILDNFKMTKQALYNYNANTLGKGSIFHVQWTLIIYCVRLIMLKYT